MTTGIRGRGEYGGPVWLFLHCYKVQFWMGGPMVVLWLFVGGGHSADMAAVRHVNLNSHWQLSTGTHSHFFICCSKWTVVGGGGEGPPSPSWMSYKPYTYISISWPYINMHTRSHISTFVGLFVWNWHRLYALYSVFESPPPTIVDMANNRQQGFGLLFWPGLVYWSTATVRPRFYVRIHFERFIVCPISCNIARPERQGE